MSIVSILKVPEYDQSLIDAAIRAHFEALQVERDIRPGMKVLLKPNLLTGRKPELATTTHPAVVRAVAQWFRAHGVRDITLADSPGGPFAPHLLDAVYKPCGYLELADVLTLNRNVDARDVKAAPGSSQDSFRILEPILEADYIVNLPKMKTHGMTTVSLGVKNLFGSIPGLLKPRLHYQNPSADGFARMLVALAETVRPNLTVIDGILAMEGNGPGGGTPRHAQLLMASRDVFAQDYIAAGLMGIDPGAVLMIKAALDRGLIDPGGIELVGDRVSALDPPFTLPDSRRLDFISHAPKFMRQPLGRFVDRHVVPLPAVLRDACVGCGRCAESCPQRIISMVDHKAEIRLRDCISCFCCQEMCPAKAIQVEKKFKWR